MYSLSVIAISPLGTVHWLLSFYLDSDMHDTPPLKLFKGLTQSQAQIVIR